jgi:molybdopterin-binding protein
MAEANTAQDFLDAIVEVLADLGSTRKVRVVAYGSIDANDPGAGRAQTPTDHSVEAIIYAYDDQFIDGSTIQEGDLAAIIDIDSLETSVISLIKSNAKLVDGSTIYAIIRATSVEVAGEKVAMMLQLR